MYVPEKLKLNKFRPVAIPRAMDIVRKLGERVMLPNQYTGDEDLNINQSKLDELKQGEIEVMKQYDAAMQEESK